jgi:hypothetical protein
VLPDGSLDANRSLNIVGVSRTSIGTSPLLAYCFDLPTSVNNVQATIENTIFPIAALPGMPPPPPGGFEMGPTEINATVIPDVAQGWGCPAGTDAAVAVTGARTFYVTFT